MRYSLYTNDCAEPKEDKDHRWMSHALLYKADKLGKDLSYKKNMDDEFAVISPLRKARTPKEEKKAEREASSSGSGRV